MRGEERKSVELFFTVQGHGLLSTVAITKTQDVNRISADDGNVGFTHFHSITLANVCG